MFKHSFVLRVPKRCIFCRSFLLFMFHVCLSYAVLSVPCNLVITCRERADLLALLFVMFSSVFCHFHIWCPGLGVVLDYIDSWSQPSSLLWVLYDVGLHSETVSFTQKCVFLHSFLPFELRFFPSYHQTPLSYSYRISIWNKNIGRKASRVIGKYSNMCASASFTHSWVLSPWKLDNCLCCNAMHFV